MQGLGVLFVVGAKKCCKRLGSNGRLVCLPTNAPVYASGFGRLFPGQFHLKLGEYLIPCSYRLFSFLAWPGHPQICHGCRFVRVLLHALIASDFGFRYSPTSTVFVYLTLHLGTRVEGHAS